MATYFGIPAPAPRTPERLKIVARLSILIWITFALIAFNLVKVYAISRSINMAGSIIFIILSLITMSLYAWLNWLYYNWLNALMGNVTRISLSMSADTLRAWFLFSMIIIFIAIAANIFTLYLSLSHRIALNGSGNLKIILQIIIYICCDISTASTRTWFRVGYSTLVWKERPRLVISMWLLLGLGVVQTVLGWIDPFAGDSGAPRVGSVAFPVLALALSGYATLLLTRLVNSTFGVSEQPPGQSMNESETLSI